VYDPHKNLIVCTNHFQSNGLSKSKDNLEQIDNSASEYRYQRLTELLNANGKNTVYKTIAILRDRKGLHNADIGMGNEKAINQLIAHHSIVFEPKKLVVWVSTSPWQLGRYMAYDLNKVFSLHGMKEDQEVADSSLSIPEDSFLLSQEYKNFDAFRKFKQRMAKGDAVNTDSLVATNPEFYHAYVIAGDYSFGQKEYQKALHYYRTALTKVIATKKEENYITAQIEKCNRQ
jgi:isopenicillin-N N-acyltransferase-like protein